MCHCTGLEINFERDDYSILEGSSNPVIHVRLQFRRTHRPFTMTIFPVSFVELNQRFNFTGETFINIPMKPEALATSGECKYSRCHSRPA